MYALMSAIIIDARDLFGDLQREARARRFKTELAAFERQYSAALGPSSRCRGGSMGPSTSRVGDLFHFGDG